VNRRTALATLSSAWLMGCGGGNESTDNPALRSTAESSTRVAGAAQRRTAPDVPPSSASDAQQSKASDANVAEKSDSATPEGTPTQPKPADVAVTLNLNKVINFDFWNGNSRYSRWQEHESWTKKSGGSGGLVKVDFDLQDLANGGAAVPMIGGRYLLLLDGKQIAVTEVRAGATSGSFQVDVDPLPHGYHILDIVGHRDEVCAPWPVYVDGAGPLPQWMPVATSSHEVVIADRPFLIKWVPAKFEPTIVPLTKRSYEHFADARSRTQLNLEQLVVGHQRRPALCKGGELTTMQRQWYTIGDAIAKVPRQPLLDGPRGRGCLGFITHAMVGTGTQTADPSSAPRGNVYVTTPWSVCRVAPDGTVTTLAGYRHPGINTYWEDPSNVELVGDFGPDEPHFHEIWGATWVKQTLAVNTSAAPIPSEDNRQPHLVGPRLLVTNPQSGRVQALDFPARSHGPAKVTTWFRGSDPWDVVGPWNGSYFVSERGAHRVLQLDVDGNIERVLLQGRALSRVEHTRLVTRLAPLETIRAEPVVGPEGLALMDDWLYIASHAMGQVIRFNLVTGERQVVKDYSSDHNYFLKIAVSDGSFGPRHTLFITSWTVGHFGLPAAFLPDGTSWSLSTYSSATVRPKGAGGNWEIPSYNGAVGVGGGRLVGGGAGEGVWELSIATAPMLDGARYNAGKKQWCDERGFWLTHSDGGFGHYGLPLPWGESPEIDYYLQCHGHTRP
jgi:hypothetical protein